MADAGAAADCLEATVSIFPSWCGNNPAGMHVVACQGETEVPRQPSQLGIRSRRAAVAQAGGGSLGDADASGARAKAVTKQPRFTEQDEEP